MSEKHKPARWRLALARALALAAVVAITVAIFAYRDQAYQLRRYGYGGIFLLSLLANATIILPAPGVALTFTFGAVFHPVWVALAAGTGAALGELTGFIAGLTGRGVFSNAAAYRRLEGWTDRYGGWAILLLAFLPNPFFDLAGAAAGALGMRVGTFLAWVWLGKTLKMLVFAFAGAASMDWALELFLHP